MAIWLRKEFKFCHKSNLPQKQVGVHFNARGKLIVPKKSISNFLIQTIKSQVSLFSNVLAHLSHCLVQFLSSLILFIQITLSMLLIHIHWFIVLLQLVVIFLWECNPCKHQFHVKIESFVSVNYPWERGG